MQFFEWNKGGSHTKIGQIKADLNELKSGEYSTSGHDGVHVENFKIEDRATFLDYIMGGCEINVHVAIDFTQSNGEITKPESLHYMASEDHINPYVGALNSVLNVVKNYDKDQQFPVYGFGAKMPLLDIPSHCFALNGDYYKPECNGVKGVIQAYYKSIQRAALWGNTQFAPFLTRVTKYAEWQQKKMSQSN